MMRPIGFGTLIVGLTLAWFHLPSHAATADASNAPAVARAESCDAVGPDDVARILGFPVLAADDASRSGGICFFASRSVSDEGSASYAIVTARDLPARRAFYAVLTRRCAGVSAVAPRAAACATYAKLAGATDLDAYFAARTDDVSAAPVASLGDSAIATADALYVRRDAGVFEIVVKRGEAFDLARATALASLVLERGRP